MARALCPNCRATFLDDAGACASCAGVWLSRETLAHRAGEDAAALARRSAARGPLTSLNCPSCRFALKSFDVAGAAHEGDLFWGLETSRPSGTAVAEGCARCGGVWIGGSDLARAGGLAAFLANLVHRL